MIVPFTDFSRIKSVMHGRPAFLAIRLTLAVFGCCVDGLNSADRNYVYPAIRD